MFKICIDNGIFAGEWTFAKVIPIFKKEQNPIYTIFDQLLPVVWN